MTSPSTFSVNKSPDQRSRSCDTVCSSNSGCFLQKRKPIHPLAASIRTSFSHPSSKSSNIRQRVLSAKLLKLRSLQSQLEDAKHHMNDIQRENLVLKTLNQRQEKALAKYEGTNADLPRLLKTHSEEMRILTEKNKSLRKTVKDLTDMVKSKDDELLTLKKQLDHLEKLNRNKHLGERQKLSEEVEDLKQKLESADNQINTLNRKLLLEGKSSKQRLSMENAKYKECQKNLMQALAEIERLTGLVDVNNVNTNKKEDKLPLRKKFSERENKSQTALHNYLNVSITDKRSDESFTSELPNDITEKIKISRTNGKLDETHLIDANGDLISPTETIKNRLSSEKTMPYDSEKCSKFSSDEKTKSNYMRPSSSQKLESLSSNIDLIVQKSKENDSTQSERTLGDYCSHVMNTIKNCSKVVEDHQESLAQSKNDTEILRDAVDELKALDNQLKRNSIFTIDPAELKKMLKYHKTGMNNTKYKDSARNKDTTTKEDPKTKLLATLRAIDNGELIDSFDSDITTTKGEVYNNCTE